MKNTKRSEYLVKNIFRIIPKALFGIPYTMK